MSNQFKVQIVSSADREYSQPTAEPTAGVGSRRWRQPNVTGGELYATRDVV
jgi:hypothetical protein